MIYRRLVDWPAWDLRRSFGEMERMRREMDRLFETVSGSPFYHPRAGVFPLINLSEDKEAYFVRAELPGISGEELDIQVTGSNLSISGERRIRRENEGARYHRRERDAGKFSRIISLPGDVNADGVNASLTNGVLTITIPKAEAAKPRQISVS